MGNNYYWHVFDYMGGGSSFDNIVIVNEIVEVPDVPGIDGVTIQGEISDAINLATKLNDVTVTISIDNGNTVTTNTDSSGDYALSVPYGTHTNIIKVDIVLNEPIVVSETSTTFDRVMTQTPSSGV